MASLLNMFRSPPTPPKTPKNVTSRGLPASWYHNSDLYELERRAIFSQRWILVSHRLRFTKPGDYLRITEAGFPFIVCLDRENTIHAFHNICRHRGFPLIHDDAGNAKIFACKYHGWSYGLNGKLAKAQHFEDFDDFEKSQNGLLPVHVHVDALGFIWINLDASPTPSMSWDEQVGGVDTQSRFQPFDMTNYHFDHTWHMDGNYNWKTLADNYNECLHCLTAHPDTVGLVDVRVYRVEGKDGHLQHFNKRQEDGLNEGKIQPNSTYLFPNACMTIAPDFFYLMRCVPTSAGTVSMEYEVYRHNDATDEAFTYIDSTFKRILTEDKWLCNNTQVNLESGVYVNGPMHPEYESGPLYFQGLVKEAVVAHKMREEREGRKIWPAMQGVGGGARVEEEMVFCEGLGCGGAKEVQW